MAHFHAFLLAYLPYRDYTAARGNMLLEIVLVASLAHRIAARTVLFASSSSTSSSYSPLPPACATFHGEYDGTSVYAYEESRCTGLKAFEDWTDTLNVQKTYHPANHAALADATARLVHVRKTRTVDADNDYASASPSWLSTVEEHIDAVTLKMQAAQNTIEHASKHQKIFVQPGSTAAGTSDNAVPRPQVVHHDTSQTSAFYSIPRSLLPVVDTLFPPTAVLVSVPTEPIPSPRNASDVPRWLADSLRNVHYSPLVDAILQDVNTGVIEKDVKHLTGEDGQSVWTTRHSFTDGGQKAAEWIKRELSFPHTFFPLVYSSLHSVTIADTVEKEAGVKCQYFHHEEGFNPNVVW